jgi:hypothetical protein
VPHPLEEIAGHCSERGVGFDPKQASLAHGVLRAVEHGVESLGQFVEVFGFERRRERRPQLTLQLAS